MDIHLKIILTSAIIWLIVHFFAAPGTKFYELGMKKFNNYTNFLGYISLVFIIPMLIALLHLIWTL